MPRRLRLRVPAAQGDRARLDHIAHRLGACPGVTSVETSPTTGSVLVHHQNSLDALLGYARQNSLFLIEAEASAMRSLSAFVNRCAASGASTVHLLLFALNAVATNSTNQTGEADAGVVGEAVASLRSGR